MSRQEPIALYCLCGMEAEGVIGSSHETYQKLRALLMKGHEGPGHGPCTRAEARRARQKAETEATKE